jgi:K+-sensing histidine kinase KdpD
MRPTFRGMAALSLNKRAADGASIFSLTRTVILRGVLTLLLVAAATAVTFVFSGALDTINLVSIIYLIPVLMAALWWGVGLAILASVAGALAADYFFYPPLYSLWISDNQNVADLIVFLIVALVGSNLAANLRQREQEITDLYEYSKDLATCFTSSDLIRATQRYLSKSLGRPALLIEAKTIEGGLSEAVAVPETIRRDAADMISRNEGTARSTLDGKTDHTWLMRRMGLGSTDYVVLVDLGIVRIGGRHKFDGRVDSAITEAANHLVRLDLARAIEEARMQAQAESLRNALVASISHDLRTPLVSILGAASVLDQMIVIKSDSRVRTLVQTVHDEAARLDGDIQNIIAAARIATGAHPVNPELTDPVDMVHATIKRKNVQLASHHLAVTLAPGLPMVEVQSTLVENALGQLLDNAAKYSAAGSTIRVNGYADHQWIVLSVSDEGAGLTADESRHAGQRSFRGARHTAATSGSGLGLWIANIFVTANGGRLDIESAGPGQGTTARIRLPVALAA